MGKIKNFTYNVHSDDLEAPASLEAHQVIGKIVKVTSANTWECRLPSKKTILVQLNSKLHNKVWVRRNGYVLVDMFSAEEMMGKVEGQIVNVVLDEKKWRKMTYWPKEFPAKICYSDSEEEESTMGKMPPSDSESE